jgi:hypothetical protein
LSFVILAALAGVGAWWLLEQQSGGDIVSETIDPTTGNLVTTDDQGNVVDTGAPPPVEGATADITVLAWGSRVSADFRSKAVQVAQSLGIDPNWLMAIMAWETGYSFSAGQRNAAGSSAVGLIQFLQSTAEGLGTSVTALAQMSPVDQLNYVQQYLQPYAGRMQSLTDAYMAVFMPSAISKPDTAVLASAGHLTYTENSRLDKAGLGYITRAMAAAPVYAALTLGMAPPNVFIGAIT